jgi:hypothetical protein
MIRFLLGTLGYMLMAGGFVTLVVDGTRSIASSGVVFMPVREGLDRVWPATVPAIRASLSQLHPLVWDPLAVVVLGIPLCVVFAVLGALLIVAARERQPRIGYDMRR